MRAHLAFVPVSLSLLLAGCHMTPLSLENGGEKIAAGIGEPAENLKFVSHADMAPTASFRGIFTVWDRGVFTVSADAIYWQPGQDEYDPTRSITQIPLNSIDEFAPDGDWVQLRINNRLYILRFMGWDSSVASQPRAEAFTELLLANNIPQFTADLSFKPTMVRSRRSSSARSLEADYQSDPNVGIAQDIRDEQNYDWAASFGNDGAVTPPP